MEILGAKAGQPAYEVSEGRSDRDSQHPRDSRADIVFSALIGSLWAGIAVWAWWAREQHRALMCRLHPALSSGFPANAVAPPEPEPETERHEVVAAQRPRHVSSRPPRPRSPVAMSAKRFRRLQQRVEVQRQLESCA